MKTSNQSGEAGSQAMQSAKEQTQFNKIKVSPKATASRAAMAIFDHLCPVDQITIDSKTLVSSMKTA